ncbi:hypothetical protein [Tabrizicola thermarum]|uniref:hypothetical protein n=1 Tax=Tabrizicola thermarum TaxID=2670345 RepID=UPI000FFB9744|nr:hypothetical protein [Tabrizicola thermarum]
MRLEDRLAALAAAGETISYGDLARELGLRMADLTARLETLMETDAAAGQPFRAALLRQRLSPLGHPAPGFFAKAAALGRSVDIDAERRALFAAARPATSAP